ncbi:hypothetical protein Kisp01_24450 [Kineosporia sp. NBRC 101677]|uniref:beta family protein n=1 Tax=Kineosporia sp. NBRC 101677 TaxID=3032197 RepID=UPI0024A21789|nr:hypothetical protein [Kineosporia sp. NBRC 101677]GLY15430.1 hypothetical protein Kisp01_24450 [Kineosporia sp. NBRC 101677]
MEFFDLDEDPPGARPAPPVYVPVLKAHAGELAALARMSQQARRRSYPLLEVMPDQGYRLHEPGGLMRWFAKLDQCWPKPVMVDGAHLSVRETGGRTALRALVQEARGLFRVMVPVIRLDAHAAVRADAAQALSEQGNGLAVRIMLTRADLDDLDTRGGAVSGRLRALLGDVGARPDEVDLIIDLAYVATDADAHSAGSRLSRALGGLVGLDSYRRLVLVAGAFPADLGRVRSWSLTRLPRADAAVWECLKSTQPGRLPVYGDYAISHPGPRPPRPPWVRPSPQLRYTTTGSWLVLRGRQKGDPRRNGQFFDICQEIGDHPEFCSDLGPADQCIADPRSHFDGPGGASRWNELGTAHHVDFVVDSLIRSGLP